ncbi:hypothetical protein AGMMS49975_25250 [Clostridia bacterium]|nr:hypothetical protein AGMMS49975_25250 [Clostridia bacterium]
MRTKVNCKSVDKLNELLGRINDILEEKYPNNPDIEYVVPKIAHALGEDGWIAVHQHYDVYFPSLTEAQHNEIDGALYDYVSKNKIGFVLWDE